MRVGFLTHYFPPEPGAPQARIGALAAGLAARGHDVVVHTGFPHYPGGRVQPPHRNALLRREHHGGVRVLRSAVAPLANRGTWRRLADHTAFALSALVTAPAAGRLDVVVAETPPLLLAGAALPYARGRGARLVLNVADLWPASAVALGALREGSAPVRLAERLEAAAYRGADLVTTPTEGLAATLADHPAAGAKVRHVGPIVDLARAAVDPPAGRSGPLRVLYVGNLGLAQGVGTLADAAALAAGEVEVTIAGGGAEEDDVRARAGAGVRLEGVVGSGRVRELYAATEVVAVLLRDLPLLRDALPTKLAEALSAGRPVVLAGAGEAAAHVRAAGGVVVAPEDPAALASALRDLRARRDELPALGARAAAYARRAFDPDATIDRWERLLTGLAGEQPRAR